MAWWEIVYFEKIDEQGNPLGGSEWEFEFAGHYRETLEEVLPQLWGDTDELEPFLGKFRIIDNWNRETNGKGGLPEIDIRDDGSSPPLSSDGQFYMIEDLDPRLGHIAFSAPGVAVIDTDYYGTNYVAKISEVKSPEGYSRCGTERPHIEYQRTYPYERVGGDDSKTFRLREDGTVKFTDVSGDLRPLTDSRLAIPGVAHNAEGYFTSIDWENTGDNPWITSRRGDRIRNEFVYREKEYTEPDPITFHFPDGSEKPKGAVTLIHPLKAVVNCKIPEPTTVTETVTETPEPSTTTVTPPTTTVTLPSTVTTTVTPPATTVTETPKTETTTATTTESATTTVTEPAKTETVTETPQRETVTHTPEKETETVTETPQKETVTETPKTETVTHTPEKETVTETPKASTETSTVTAPQVTVTETPKQVTETTTLPQKTVTEQVPITVVENKTETVKVPPVTVTETEKQEPTTVTETPEKTTVVETQPSETTVGSSSSSVESSAPVETTTPSETSTPTSERGTASRVLASTGANVVGFAVLAGLLAGLGVFVTRRRE